MNYILIDYENVHPANLDPLDGHKVEVRLFVGPSQSSLPSELAESMQKLGDKAQYVLVKNGGPNSLDFHLAYYLGILAAHAPGSYFHIVSKDKGFDPLVKHLSDGEVKAFRADDLNELKFLKPVAKMSSGDLMDRIVENLKKRGPSRPNTEKALARTLANDCSAVPGAPSGEELVKTLSKRKLIEVSSNGAVTYLPPITKS